MLLSSSWDLPDPMEWMVSASVVSFLEGGSASLLTRPVRCDGQCLPVAARVPAGELFVHKAAVVELVNQ